MTSQSDSRPGFSLATLTDHPSDTDQLMLDFDPEELIEEPAEPRSPQEILADFSEIAEQAQIDPAVMLYLINEVIDDLKNTYLVAATEIAQSGLVIAPAHEVVDLAITGITEYVERYLAENYSRI